MSGEGAHAVAYRSADLEGNVGAARSGVVHIDSRRPTTRAPRRASARRNAHATLRYRVNDPLPSSGRAMVAIKVKTLGGKTVKTYRLASRKAVNAALTYKVSCTFKRGTYRFFVYATDLADNKQVKAGRNLLTVK